MTLEKAIESWRFGFSVTYDGDHQAIKYGTNCNHCGKYFESYDLVIYCLDCCIKYISETRKVMK